MDSPAAAAQAASNARRNSCTGCPGTLWWISAFGSRSARSDGVLDVGHAGGERQGQRPVGVEGHPRRAPSPLVAGALDDHPAGAEGGPHRVPGLGRRGLVVLAQHVERPHEHRLQSGQFESADPEVDPRRVAVGGDRGHAGRVDLQADDLEAVDLRAQPVDEFERRDRRRAVAEVDDERAGRVAEAGELGGEEPAVDPAQAVGVGRSARGQPQRAGPAGGQPGSLALRRRRQVRPGACGRSGARSPVRRVVPASVGSCRFYATVRLADLTTLGVGGVVDRVIEVEDAAELVAAVREADEAGRPLLLLGGGSNVVAPDDGWPGDVVAVRTPGDRAHRAAGSSCRPASRGTTSSPTRSSNGLAGIEALSGIPGSTGATPVQNVGAYGQEVAQTITAVRVYDRAEKSERTLTPAECGFAYRDSRLKREPGRFVVLDVTFELRRERRCPARSGYAELARTLGVEIGRARRRWPTSARR